MIVQSGGGRGHGLKTVEASIKTVKVTVYSSVLQLLLQLQLKLFDLRSLQKLSNFPTVEANVKTVMVNAKTVELFNCRSN